MRSNAATVFGALSRSSAPVKENGPAVIFSSVATSVSALM